MDSVTVRMQKIELDILKEFKRICEKYSLRYYAIGGTCIGAVRHKGFIPWDDDIDVAMPFEDYKKFIEVSGTELKEPYLLYRPEEHRPYQFNFIKIHNTDTFYIRKHYAPYPDRYTGVFFDIMPIYGTHKNKLVQLINSLQCDIWLYRNWAQRLPVDFYPGSVKWKFIWYTTKMLSGKKPFDYYIKKIESRIGKYPFDNSDKIIFGWRKSPLLHRDYSKNNVFFREDFAESIEVPFEDTTIRIPKGYDRYLKIDFGDYMKIPPEEKQVSMHQENCVIDLENSYRKYQSGEIKLDDSVLQGGTDR